MAVPYTFATATGSLPLSQLDSNFSTAITIGNTSVVLGDTITTVNNLSLANVAITSVATQFPNKYLANSNVIVGTTTLNLGSTVTTIDGLTLGNVTIASGNVTITNVAVTTANVSGTANISSLVVLNNTVLGDATTDTLTVGVTGIVKDASGNVGIGTASPSYKLNTYAATTSLSIQYVAQNSNTGAGTAAIGFSLSNVGTEGVSTKGGIGFQRGAPYGGGFMAFYNNNSGAAGDFTTADEKMRIDSSGNVGIGTSSPSTYGKLAIYSASAASSVATVNGGTTISDYAQQIVYANAQQYYVQNLAYGNGLCNTAANPAVGQYYSIGTVSSTPMLFNTGNTERMRIDTVGNVQVQSGAVMPYAPTPTSIAAATTLTNAQIQAQIINTTGTTYTVTMPLGTTLETLATWATTNVAYDFFVINTASGTITIGANSNTTLGSLTIATGVSAQFRIRRTAANTFTIYRLG
jgi:translation initiation factor 1 (eIF-1/SUI1)